MTLVVVNWRRVGEGGVVHDGSNCGYLGDGGGVGNRRDGLHAEGFLAYDRVESVVGVSGVVHSAPGAVGVHERVGALHDIPVAGFVLTLRVSGQTVLHVIREAVLRVSVVLFDGYLRDGCDGGVFGYRGGGVGDGSGVVGDGARVVRWGSGVGNRAGVVRGSGVADRRSWQKPSAGRGHQAREGNELKTKEIVLFQLVPHFLSIFH